MTLFIIITSTCTVLPFMIRILCIEKTSSSRSHGSSMRRIPSSHSTAAVLLLAAMTRLLTEIHLGILMEPLIVVAYFRKFLK